MIRNRRFAVVFAAAAVVSYANVPCTAGQEAIPKRDPDDAAFDRAYEADRRHKFFDLNEHGHEERMLAEVFGSRKLKPVCVWGANDEVVARISKADFAFSLELRGEGVTDKSIAHIAKMHQLRELIVVDTSIKGDQLEQLGALTHLRHLKIAGTKLENASFRFLEKMPDLNQLTLVETGFSEEDLAHLGNCSNLRVLYVPDVRLTDRGLIHFGVLKELKYLFIDENTSQKGAVTLRQILPDTKIFN
jgi:hypothetical protein